jgi:hypothetical protein
MMKTICPGLLLLAGFASGSVIRFKDNVGECRIQNAGGGMLSSSCNITGIVAPCDSCGRLDRVEAAVAAQVRMQVALQAEVDALKVSINQTKLECSTQQGTDTQFDSIRNQFCPQVVPPLTLHDLTGRRALGGADGFCRYECESGHHDAQNTGTCVSCVSTCTDGGYEVKGACSTISSTSCGLIENFCPAAATFANGAATVSSRKLGSTAAIVCDTLSIPVDSPTLTCGVDGQWAVSGSCKPPACAASASLANGQVTVEPLQRSLGNSAAITCNHGYRWKPVGASGSFTMSSVTGSNPTATGIYIRFKVNGAWTSNEWWFPGSSDTQSTTTQSYTLAAFPTEVAFDNQHSGDGWTPSSITITPDGGDAIALGGGWDVDLRTEFVTIPAVVTGSGPEIVKCVAPANCGGGQFTVKTTAGNNPTDTGIIIRFKINGAWTEQEWWFSGSSQAVHERSYSLAAFPTEVQFDNQHSGDGWSPATVTITPGGGDTIDLGGGWDVDLRTETIAIPQDQCGVEDGVGDWTAAGVCSGDDWCGKTATFSGGSVGGCTGQFTMKTTAGNNPTDTGIHIRFKVDGAWTSNEWWFSGSSQAVHERSYSLAAFPTEVQFDNQHSGDGWSPATVTITPDGGDTIDLGGGWDVDLRTETIVIHEGVCSASQVGSTKLGDVHAVTCADYHVPISNPSVVCSDDRTWQPSGSCHDQICPTSAVFVNGVVTVVGRAHGNEAVVTCNQGFQAQTGPTGKFTVRTTAGNNPTDTGIIIRFKVNGAWTEQEWWFSGSSQSVHVTAYDLAAFPTEVQFDNDHSGDGWSPATVTITPDGGDAIDLGGGWDVDLRTETITIPQPAGPGGQVTMKCAEPSNGGEFTLKTTSGAGDNPTDTGIYIRFKVDGAWASNEWWFSGSSQAVHERSFSLAAFPTEVAFDNQHSGDGWSPASVTITPAGGSTIDLGGGWDVDLRTEFISIPQDSLPSVSSQGEWVSNQGSCA